MKRTITIILALCAICITGFSQNKKYKPLTSWPFVYEDFQPGRITTYQGAAIEYDQLNISLINGKPLFIKDGKIMADQKSGSIINVSSMAAYDALSRVMGYAIAKEGVNAQTKWLAQEMAIKYSEKIRVNAIAPGFFIGEQNRRALINEDGTLTERSHKVIAKTPMRRFGDISELNGIVRFLCSDEASFVTGTIIPVDGGFSSFSGV